MRELVLITGENLSDLLPLLLELKSKSLVSSSKGGEGSLLLEGRAEFLDLGLVL